MLNLKKDFAKFSQEVYKVKPKGISVFNQIVVMLKKAFKKTPNNTYLTLHSAISNEIIQNRRRPIWFFR